MNIEESNNLNISKLIKERDHALALVGVLKKEKLSLEVGHSKLLEDFASLDKAHKALKKITQISLSLVINLKEKPLRRKK